MLTQQAVDLILAGALLSITLNPLAFVATRRLAVFLECRRDVMSRIERFRRSPEGPAVAAGKIAARDHVVIIGYGTVGRMVADGLAAASVPFAVIDGDRRAVESLRQSGFLAVHGDAIASGLLGDAGADRAKLVVVTTPEGYATRRIVELVRELNPGTDMAARADTDEEAAEFARLGVGAVVKPERAMAADLLRHVLRSVGTPEDRVADIVAGAKSGGWDAAERSGGEPSLHVPELRPHRDQA